METGESFSTLYARRLSKPTWYDSKARVDAAPMRLERIPAFSEELFLNHTRRSCGPKRGLLDRGEH